MAPKRRCSCPRKASETPPEVKRMRRQRKYDVNRRIAVELVNTITSDRGRVDEEVVQGIFARYVDVYGEELVDKNQAIDFARRYLKGKPRIGFRPIIVCQMK